MTLALLSLLACGSPSGGDSGTFDFSNGDATNGATVFGNTCINCHGADGKQGTVVSGTPAADLTVRVPADTDDFIVNQVQNGGAIAMPAQGLSDSDTADVLAYVRATFP